MSYITEVDILNEAKECFLTYSEEVLTDRAIPSAEDGLLSAQRKILWTMEDYLKMDNKSKTKKCNAIVGSTLATSYFHGDQACYGVLCKMSQDYLMRYPLIHGQGSLGTQENNDMVASSRYTEAKPSIFADLMMNDFKKEVVPMKETYNGEFMEPVILPGLFPNAICNGRQAIGISMAHCSAPHNLTEVCNAAIKFIQQNGLTVDELLEVMPGPDFPLGGRILNSKDIKSAFATGKSSVSLKIQGDYEVEGDKIIFTTIPYRTYRNKIKEQIEKNIDTFAEVLDDYDDASSVGQNRLIFYVKKGVPVGNALNKLFLLTDLQTTLSYNMNYIVNGTPKLCSMVDLIREYVKHQENILIRATTFDKEKAEARAHVLRGLIAAVDKIDEVIALIKASESKTEARERLISFLSIDDIQANAILDMKLGKLTRIDKQELIDELKEKEAFIDKCLKILSNEDTRKALLIERITKLRNDYGDARRTQLLNVELPKKEKVVEEVVPENCVVVVTSKGTVKRVPKKSFKTANRATVGTKTTDIARFTSSTNTADTLMVFTSKGKMYRTSVNNIPEGANASAGVLLSSIIEFDSDELPMAFTTLSRDNGKNYIFFATKKGVVKKVPLEEYDKMKRTGIIAIAFKEGDSLATATFIEDEDIMLTTRNGMVIKFATRGMPVSSRTAQGVKGINIADSDEVIAAMPVSADHEFLAVVSETGVGKKVPLTEFNIQNRAGKGVLYYKNAVAGTALVSKSDQVLISGNKSSIVLSCEELPTLSRISMGNILIKNNDKITSIVKI